MKEKLNTLWSSLVLKGFLFNSAIFNKKFNLTHFIAVYLIKGVFQYFLILKKKKKRDEKFFIANILLRENWGSKYAELEAVIF